MNSASPQVLPGTLLRRDSAPIHFGIRVAGLRRALFTSVLAAVFLLTGILLPSAAFAQDRNPDRPPSEQFPTEDSPSIAMRESAMLRLWDRLRLGQQPDIAVLQPLLQDGKSEAVLEALEEWRSTKPRDPRLHYNLGVAAYAAGRLDEALIAFDLADFEGNRRLKLQSRFQKGNVEYRLGQQTRTTNLDETIIRWKLALQLFEEVLQADPAHVAAETNRDVVRGQLMELLLSDARVQMEQANKSGQHPRMRIENLRNAFDKYTDALEVDEDNTEAQEGEQESREQLAQALANMGRQLANMPFRHRPNPREPALPDLDLTNLEEGVGMLRDANTLKPDDPAIARALQDAQNRLADADVIKARSYMALEERIGWVREKLAVLRMAREVVEQALQEVPDHQTARDTHEEINRRLADIHEDEGDLLAQLASPPSPPPASNPADQQSQNNQQARQQNPFQPPFAQPPTPLANWQQPEVPNLERQTMQLTQALDHYQQSKDLAPENTGLDPKMQDVAERLANALDQLADQLMMPGGPNESLEQQAARLEGADQALGQLDGLQPSQRTSERARQVGQQLQALREAMAAQSRGKQPGDEPGEGSPRPGQQPGQQMVRFGIPMDSRPKINTPGMHGEWNSRIMSQGKDY